MLALGNRMIGQRGRIGVSFGSALIELLFHGRVLTAELTDYPVLVFGVGCCITSVLILILDICVFVIRGRSFLRLAHSLSRTRFLFVVVPAAGGIVGILGLAVDVLQASLQAGIVVGFAWHFILAAIAGSDEGIGRDEDLGQGGEPLR